MTTDPLSLILTIIAAIALVAVIVVWEVARCLDEEDVQYREYHGSNPMDRETH